MVGDTQICEASLKNSHSNSQEQPDELKEWTLEETNLEVVVMTRCRREAPECVTGPVGC